MFFRRGDIAGAQPVDPLATPCSGSHNASLYEANQANGTWQNPVFRYALASLAAPSGWWTLNSRRFTGLSFVFIAGVAFQVFSTDPLISTAVLCLLGLLALISCDIRAAIAVLSLFAVGYSYGWLREPRPDASDVCRYAGHRVSYTGTVSELRRTAGSTSFVVNVSQVDCSEGPVAGKVSVLVPQRREFCCISRPECAKQSLVDGGPVTIDSTIRSPQVAAQPFEYDFRKALGRRGIFCQSRITCDNIITSQAPRSEQGSGSKWTSPGGFEICRFGGLVESVVQQLRFRISSLHEAVLGPERGAVLASMVLGDRAVDLPESMRKQFRAAGLSHVLAASGYNLTVVILMVSSLTALFVRTKVSVAVCAMGGVVVFVLLAGCSPSVLRAAIMCSMVLVLRCWNRRPYMPSIFASALLLCTLWSPVSLCDIGLELSYIATAAMIFGSRSVLDPVSSWSDFRRRAAELCGVTLLAQAAVLPVQLLYFYEASLYFLPSNILASVLVPIICSCGFASSVLALLPNGLGVDVVARLLDWFVSLPLGILLFFVEYISELPFAVVALGPPPVVAVVIFYSSLCLLLFRCGRRFRLFVVAGLLIGVGGLVVRLPLEKETIVRLGRVQLTIHRDRTASCCGDANHSDASSKKIRRVLAYYGARVREKPVSGNPLNEDLPRAEQSRSRRTRTRRGTS
jgi:ComEC/Rec2-related protein